MQFTIALLSTVLALALAGPIPEAVPVPARADASAALAETCTISGTVNCRYHTNTQSTIEHVFTGGSAYFTCNSPGECINGNWYVSKL